MLTRAIIPLLSLSTLVSPLAAGASLEWGTNLSQAFKQAQAQNSLVLLFFTGSDWCSNCITLKSKILQTEEFKKFATQKAWQLVEVDVPRGASVIDPKLKKVNQSIVARYKVSGFPSMLVLSPEGYVLGGFVHGRDLISVVLGYFEAAEPLALMAQKARKLQGFERAKALLALHEALPYALQVHNGKLLDELASLDPNDALGLKVEQARRAKIEPQYQRALASFEAVRDDEKAARAQLNQLIVGDFEPEVRARFMMILSSYLYSELETLEDVKDFLKLFDDALALSPREEQVIMMHKDVHRFFAKPQEALNTLKAQRQQR